MNKYNSIIAFILIFMLLFCSACTDSSKFESEPNTTTEAVTEVVSDSESKIDVYAGPGKDYIKLNSITEKEIKNYLKYENEWIEIDYGAKRGYIPVGAVDDIDVNKIPHVVYAVNSNVYPYPTIYNSKININLFDAANVYYIPKSSGTPTNIESGKTVTILYSEKSTLKTYVQIEFDTEKGKRRGYCDSTDLLSFDNPLLNFKEEKQKNICISYKGDEYYSSNGEASVLANWWNKTEEMTLGKTKIDLLSGVTGVIAGNDINDETIESTQGKLQLYSTKDRQYINANTSNRSATAKISIVDFILGSTISFVENGVKTFSMDVRLDEYNGEKRIVIKTGSPIESSRAGKEMELSDLIVEKNNTALTVVESGKKADEAIEQMYPNLDKSKTYSMKMKFSKDFSDNNYGYYIVIDNNLEVYAVPIIHAGTSFQVFSEDGFVCDAAWDLATSMIKVDDETKNIILNLLAENDFVIKGLEYNKPSIKIPDSAFEYNGHHYNFYKNNCETWEEAQKFCEDLGGHLAIIDNEDENIKLYDFMKTTEYESAYFGLTDSENEGVWKNVDGSEPKFINWSDGEPNNERGIENYAMFYYKSPEYKWNDGEFRHRTVNDPSVFICEWDV